MNKLRLITDYSPRAFAVVAAYDCFFDEEFKLIGGRFNSRLACGGGWIFSTAKHLDSVKNLIAAYGIEFEEIPLTHEERQTQSDKQQARRESKQGGGAGGKRATSASTPTYILSDEERRAWVDTFATARKWDNADYWLKLYPIVCRLENGEIVPIATKKLETVFWHHDEGAGYEAHKEITSTSDNMSKYFISDNLEDLNNIIDGLQGKRTGTSYEYLWLANWHEDKNNWELQWSNINPESTNAVEFLDRQQRKMYDEGKYRKISEGDKQRLSTAYKLAYDKRKKRCETWLKRYGVDKLSFRTYWADR